VFRLQISWLTMQAERTHFGGLYNARTCPLNRQGTAAAAHPHACFSKGCSSTASCTPLQRLWGSKAHTNTHIHSCACACAHTYTNTRANTHRRAHTQTHAQTHRHARAHIHTHRHIDTHARKCTRARVRAYTCICTHALCALWASPLFSIASDAPSLVYLTL